MHITIYSVFLFELKFLEVEKKVLVVIDLVAYIVTYVERETVVLGRRKYIYERSK